MKRSEETKQKQSLAKKGKKYIYNAKLNIRKLVSPDIQLEEGWVYGYGPRKSQI